MTVTTQHEPKGAKPEPASGTGEGADTALEAMIKKRQARPEDELSESNSGSGSTQQE